MAYLFSKLLQAPPIGLEFSVLVGQEDEQVFLFFFTFTDLIHHLFAIDFNFCFLHLQLLHSSTNCELY